MPFVDNPYAWDIGMRREQAAHDHQLDREAAEPDEDKHPLPYVARDDRRAAA